MLYCLGPGCVWRPLFARLASFGSTWRQFLNTTMALLIPASVLDLQAEVCNTIYVIKDRICLPRYVCLLFESQVSGGQIRLDDGAAELASNGGA